MWLCLCNGVNHETVSDAIEHGARSVRDIGRACQAGTTCRGCVPILAKLLRDHRAATASPSWVSVDTLRTAIID
jgi:bacterioferritin-associated ferredoxin